MYFCCHPGLYTSFDEVKVSLVSSNSRKLDRATTAFLLYS
jgi:hypothetical protein